MPNNRVIYTVITNGYDSIFPPVVDQPGWDLICFTDDPNATSKHWQMRPLPELDEFSLLADDPVRKARLVKLLPHRFLQEYEYSVFIDGNRVLAQELSPYVDQYPESTILCFESLAGDAYAAADVLLDRKPSMDELDIAPVKALDDDDRHKLIAQTKKWEKAGLAEYSGCPGTAVLGRKHNNPQVVQVMETWAKEVLEGCRYDEPSFPYACFVNGVKWTEGLSQRARPNELHSPAEQLAVAMPHLALMLGDNPPPKPTFPPNPPPPGGPYEGYPHLLTVAAPVSNQIGTIRRCLEGLKPLLDAIDSELLIADTGSTDGTIEVCREFGARVIEFPWVNDMSAARNTLIRNARGMWFMSFDDDEWFEDLTEIIEFFKRPEQYKHFNIGQYQQYNYMDEFGATFSLITARRMGRNTPELHFEGRIHDALHSGENPQLIHFSCNAYHYGFEQSHYYRMKEKIKRNTMSLRYDIAQFPYDLRYTHQQIKEYIVAKSYPTQVGQFVYWALSHHREIPNNHFSSMSAGYWFNYLSIEGKFQEAVCFAERFLDIGSFTLNDRCTLHFVFSLCYTNVGKQLLALQHIESYEQCRKEILAKSKTEQEDFVINDKLRILRYAESFARQIEQAKARNLLELRKVRQFEQLIDKTHSGQLAGNPNFRHDVLRYYYQTQQWNGLKNLLLSRRKQDNDSLLLLYPELIEITEDKYVSILLEILHDIEPVKSSMQPLLRLFVAKEKDSEAAELVKQVLDGLVVFVPEEARIFKVLALLESIRLGLDTTTLFDRMEIVDIDYCTAYLQKVMSPRVEMYIDRLVVWCEQSNSSAGDMEQYFRVETALLLYRLRTDESDKQEKRYLTRFVDAIKQSWEWNRHLFAPKLVEGKGSPLLPRKVRTICLLHYAIEQQNAGTPLEALRTYKQALDLDNTLQLPVNMLVDEVTQLIESDLANGKTQQTEFEMLLSSVKPKIKQLIESGLLSEARTMVAQLETLVPQDSEVQALKAKTSLLPPS